MARLDLHYRIFRHLYRLHSGGSKLKFNSAGLCILEAADFMGLAPEDIEWAIEEYGGCDTSDYLAVVAGDPLPMPRAT